MARRSRPTRSHARPIARARLWLTLLLGFLCTAGAPPAHSTPLIHPPIAPLPATATQPTPPTAAAPLPRVFIPNRGQTGAAVRYHLNGDGGTVFSLANHPVLPVLTDLDIQTKARDRLAQSVVGQHFTGAASVTPTATDPSPARINYAQGDDPAQWQSGLPTYADLTYSGLYPGIDLHYAADGGHLKSTYTLAPGSAVGQIAWRYDRGAQPSVDAAGNLVVTVPQLPIPNAPPARTITDATPVAWQMQGGQRSPVSVRYSVGTGGSVGFVVGSYDQSQPLLIDPQITYGTFLGGSGNDWAWGVARAQDGSTFITGQTNSPYFPTGNAATNSSGNDDVFVTKLSASGQYVYTTIVGGSGQDEGYGIALDSANLPYITGRTESTGFPGTGTSSSAYQKTRGGNSCSAPPCADAFVTTLNSDGTLHASTYVGAGGEDRGGSIALDRSTSGANTIIIGGQSDTAALSNFGAKPGGIDGFVAKFNANLSSLIYGKYVGGSNDDQTYGVAVDSTGNAYATGMTLSTNFPTQSGGGGIFQSGRANCSVTQCADAFVTKLNPSGGVVYATYLGGAGGDDRGNSIAVDSAGNAYITGSTKSTVFPGASSSAIQSVKGGNGCTSSPCADAFVAKLNASGSALGYATYLGGNETDIGQAIDVDANGNAYVVGQTASPTGSGSPFPTTNTPTLPGSSYNGGSFHGAVDAFVTEINAAGSSVVMSTYVGGTGSDYAEGVVVDPVHKVIVVGKTNSADFPLYGAILGAYQGGTNDAFVTHIDSGALNGATLALSRNSPASGINSLNTSQSLVARLTVNNVALIGFPVTFSVNGANAPGSTHCADPQPSTTTDSSGNIGFCYVGTNVGTDTIQASATSGAGTTVTSPSVSVSWTNLNGSSLTLGPSTTGPVATNTSVTVKAVFVDANLAPVGNAAIQFSITGPNAGWCNAHSCSATTDTNGTYYFSYQGTVAGTDTLQVSAGNGQVVSNTVTVTWTTLAGVTLDLSPTNAGPNLIGSPQTVTATAKNASGTALSSIPVTFTVRGANAPGCPTAPCVVTTQADGTAQFTYTGNSVGYDSITASTTDTVLTVQSNDASIGWKSITSGATLTLQATTPTTNPNVVGVKQNFKVILRDNANVGQDNKKVQYTVRQSDGSSVASGEVTTQPDGTATFDYTATQAGTYTVQATTKDTPTVRSNVISANWITLDKATLVLSPTLIGTAPVGSTQPLVATVFNTNNQALCDNITITFTIVDADNGNTPRGTPTNIAGCDATTGKAGAPFGVTRPTPGHDHITATVTSGGQTLSASSDIYWTTSAPQVTTSAITGQFFPNPGESLAFNIAPGTSPLFTQSFPLINFSHIDSSPAAINTAQPMIDTVIDPTGAAVGTIPVQGNGYTPGQVAPSGKDLTGFQAVFTGQMTVTAAGRVTFQFTADDGMIFGVGANAHGKSAAAVTGNTHQSLPDPTQPPSPRTPFTNLPQMGGWNDGTTNGAYAVFTLSVDFPEAGTYPFEVDYACLGTRDKHLVLQMRVVDGGGTVKDIPQTATLRLSTQSDLSLPTPQTQTVGTAQDIYIKARDIAGNALNNQTVVLNVVGTNAQTLTQQTAQVNGVDGIAHFVVNGTQAGDSQIQATTFISGSPVYSNAVNVTWQNPPPDPNNPTQNPAFDAPGWIATPINGSSLTADPSHNAAYPITLIPNVCLVAHQNTSGQTDPNILQYWRATDGLNTNPPSDTSRITILTNTARGSAGAQITDGSGGAGLSFDPTRLPNGTYIIQLRAWGKAVSDCTNATASVFEQISQVLVTVVGEYKPGRVTYTVTDATVPVAGMPLTIGRTYDSLNRSTIGDFGYSWTLVVGGSDIAIDPQNNVTLTLPGGRRVTFYMGVGNLRSGLSAVYTPEPGVYGTLTSNGCGFLVPTSRGYLCFPGTFYDPTQYTYTDPYGRVYTLQRQNGAWQLASAVDLNGNALQYVYDPTTHLLTGITNSIDGRSINIIRDAAVPARITTIEVKDGTSVKSTYRYMYAHTGSIAGGGTGIVCAVEGAAASDLSATLSVGDLCQVTLPTMGDNTTPTAVTYTYKVTPTGVTPPSPLTHLFMSASTPAGVVVNNTYYEDATKPEYGRIASAVDTLEPGKTFPYTYGYNFTTNSITVTNPDGGTITTAYTGHALPLSTSAATYFKLASKTETVGGGYTRTTQYGYDQALNQTVVSLPKAPTSGTGNWNAADAPANLDGSVCAPRNVCTQYDAQGRPIQITDAVGNITQNAYNRYGGLLIKKAYPNGVGANQPVLTQTVKYDTKFNVASVSDDMGTLGGYTFNTHGNPTDTYFGNNPQATSHYVYDGYGNRTSETNPLNSPTNYGQYDTYGRPQTISQPYSSNGTSRTDSATYRYDDFGNVLCTVDPAGNVTKYSYDAAGNKTAEQFYPVATTCATTNAAAWQTTYTYYYNGKLKSVTSPDNTVVTYTYDYRGNTTTQKTTTTTNPTTILRETDSVYNQAGAVTSVTSGVNTPDGTATLTCYDVAGRMISQSEGVTIPLTTPTQIDNACASIPATGALPSNLPRTTRYTYDNADRVITTTDPMGMVTKNYFDQAGRLQKTVNQTQHTGTFYTYNARGFATDTTYGATDASDNLNVGTTANPIASATTHQEFDASGNVVTSLDRAGKPTTYTYDAANRLTSVTNPRGETVAYCLDRYGSVTTIFDAKNSAGANCSALSGNHTDFVYDALNRLTKKTWPGGTFETTSYSFSGSNSLATQVLADGTTCRIAQTNAIGQLTQISYKTGAGGTCQTATTTPTVSYSYYATGERNTAVTGTDTTTYTYDGVGRLKTVTSPIPNQSLAYSYDAVGNRLKLDVVNGGTTTTTRYAYDADNRLCNVQLDSATTALGTGCVSADANTYAYSYTNTSDGYQTRSVTYPVGTGIVATSTSDPIGRLTSLSYAKSGATLPQYSYCYGADGKNVNRTAVAEGSATCSAPTVAWEYDGADRLTREKRTGTGGWETRYTYDANGNRSAKLEYDATGSIGKSSAYSYNSRDQIVSLTVNGGVPTSYSYDGRGNLIGDGTNSYAYDAADRLISATMPSNHSASYGYDADGRRVSSITDGVTTKYVWDEASVYGDVVAELNSSNAVTMRYTLGGSEVLAQKAGTGAGMPFNFLLHDGQGNTRSLVDNTGANPENYTYDAFGTLTPQIAAPKTRYLYAGQQFDTATGLYSIRARYYNTTQGRFLSRDVAKVALRKPHELNRYAYTSGNPVNSLDPSGHETVLEGGEINENQDEEASAEVEGAGENTEDAIDKIQSDEDAIQSFEEDAQEEQGPPNPRLGRYDQNIKPKPNSKNMKVHMKSHKEEIQNWLSSQHGKNGLTQKGVKLNTEEKFMQGLQDALQTEKLEFKGFATIFGNQDVQVFADATDVLCLNTDGVWSTWVEVNGGGVANQIFRTLRHFL